ncbi:hypothetical protein [Paracoccus sp. PAR01]|uniref:hypothetical protein n=1 Tax=Paracoccus sp. PAR01 TaxID=2769282 RepID=UPI00177FBDC8|nr:hypothetical protein [Paracoccus sp. PAR01]MBD9529169.1 hypothetical protein [Paracoccus sp. PAR01]
MRNKVSFGNLSVTSSSLELLDYADVVVRAVLENQEPRKTSRNRYYFLDVDLDYLVKADPTSLSLYGRFVNDTILEREQVLIDGKLIAQPEKMKTAPSAFFIFNLLDHRLTYMPETSGAPRLSTLGNTMEFFIKRKHDQILRERHKETGRTLTNLRQDFPLPAVHLTPIVSRLALDDFVKKFSKITSISIKVIKRNQDLSPGELFFELADEVGELEPTSSRLEIQGGKDGLNIIKAQEFIGDVAEHGYEDARLVGLDRNGAKISGSNEDFSLSVVTDAGPEEARGRAEHLYAQYLELKRNRQITIQRDDAKEDIERLKEIHKKHG